MHSDEVTKLSLYLYTRYFKKYPSEFYSEWSYEEQWEPFLKIQKGDNLIVGIGYPGLPSNLIEKIMKSKFNQKILFLKEVPWNKEIKRVYNNISSYLKLFDKIYTYVKPLTNNKNIFYLGSFFSMFQYKTKISRMSSIDFDKKLNRIGMVLAEHSRREVLKTKKIMKSFKNPKKFGELFSQLIGHPNARFKFGGLQYNKLYGVRSNIARYFDKMNIIDIYGKSGWEGTKNYKGICDDAMQTLFKYRWDLSIENNNIDNYFSEKPFFSLLECCVPIVLGGPTPSDILPKGSYVDLQKISYKEIPYYVADDENYYRHLEIIKKNYTDILNQYHTHYKFIHFINTNEDLVFKS